MITVHRATKVDLPGITNLFSKQSKASFYPEMVNSKDVSLVAYKDSVVVGFMWAGLMAKNTMAYLDMFLVAPHARSSGVTKALRGKMLQELKKRNVKRLFAIIRKDEHYEKAAWNSLKGAMGSDGYDYVYVRNNLDTISKELSVPGDAYAG